MRERREIIFQGALESEPFADFTDFLVRSDDGSYEVWDTKLARKSKPYHLVQLCCYAEMLENLTGQRPEIVQVVLGNDEKVPFRTAEFFGYYLQLKEAFLTLMERFSADDEPPFPDPRADHRLWSSAAEDWLKKKDHLVQVAGITTGQIAKLEEAGVNTLAALASCDLTSIPKMKNEIFQRLREQARIQEESRKQPEGSTPKFEILTPAPEDPHRGLALLPPALSQRHLLRH